MSTRDDLRRTGAETREHLFGTRPGGGGPMDMLADEALFGAVWSRPGLARADRMICALAALGGIQRHKALAGHVAAALDLGLAPRAIVEIMVQVGIYAGFAAAEDAVETAGEVFAARGIAMPEEQPDDATAEDLTARGQDLMRRLHGARADQGYAAPGNTVTGALYPLAIRYGYGAIWFRPGLVERQRALVAVAAFTALKLDGQVAKFGRSALNMGLSKTEVIEAVIQTAPLSGFAPALNALAGLSDALGD